MKKITFTLLFVLFITPWLIAGTQNKTSNKVKGKKVLIYTKNGKGYVHENIASSVKALEAICSEYGILTDATDKPSAFTTENLKQYDAIIFSNTNNKVFDTKEQRKSLQNFVRQGGGIVAIHSANAMERDWPWMWSMIGGKFVRHAPGQNFDLVITDNSHPSTYFLHERWNVTDECYYSNQLNPDIHVLLSADLTTVTDKNMDEYPGETFGKLFPLCWCHEFDGGREWFTALGHNADFYSDPLFKKHLLGGILWVLGVEKLNY